MKPTPFWMRAQWGNLVMATWMVEPDLIREQLPPGCEPDCWEGKVPLSLVGVEFSEVEVKGASWPWHGRFAEVNLRTYTQGPQGPGVVFIKELVPKFFVALLARRVYGEPYEKMKVQIEKHVRDGQSEMAYRWEAGERISRLSARAAEVPRSVQKGTIEEFLLSRGRGYNSHRGGTTYEISHEPWSVRDVRRFAVDCSTGAPFGASYGSIFRTEPDSILFSDGSPVKVGFPTRISA